MWYWSKGNWRLWLANWIPGEKCQMMVGRQNIKQRQAPLYFHPAKINLTTIHTSAVLRLGIRNKIWIINYKTINSFDSEVFTINWERDQIPLTSTVLESYTEIVRRGTGCFVFGVVIFTRPPEIWGAFITETEVIGHNGRGNKMTCVTVREF